MPAIAIVGIACRYPDAKSPSELWETALAQRQAFRRIPSERLRLEDYFSLDRNEPDHTYSAQAGLIEDYQFDRVRFRVAGNTFRSADLAHWLALDVADQALKDAGFPQGQGLPGETTGVIVGNTLTGEFSRAGMLRLRWPYVRRVIDAELLEKGWPPEQRSAFLKPLELAYKRPFPAVGEETLAGGLSNTIAGRICNHFDLKGGGYTVDAACAASLLAICAACSALTEGDLDVALAGGVDLSLDPFELVGFAKAGALAAEQMRVYDARPNGFWPGEGCGFVVLMRQQEASAQGCRIYAVIRGWGISSDGGGGVTRPEAEGQLLALRRAYRRAGFGIDTVAYLEGHGTGTAVGDATELRALLRAREDSASPPVPAVLGTIKANIGHTKAAAGVAGLIKAAMAVHSQILPPTTGCDEPHPALKSTTANLTVTSKGKLWGPDCPLRAGVSAMGFGGINTHLVLEAAGAARRTTLDRREQLLLSSAQDSELFLLSGSDKDQLQRQVEHMLTFAAELSRAELTDLAAWLERTLDGCAVRAALVARTPAELTARLKILKSLLSGGTTATELEGVFFSSAENAPRIGFLFPGQASPVYFEGGALSRRFDFVEDLYVRAKLPNNADRIATDVAQPAIVVSSLAALRVLEKFGVRACIAAGHSLGEFTALHWAGVMEEATLLRIVKARGIAMAELSGSAGAMASVGAEERRVEELLEGEEVVIAGLNSPCQTVVSGAASAVARLVERALAAGLSATNLPVSCAFHSPLMAPAVSPLAKQLSNEQFHPSKYPVISSISGAPIAPDEDLRQLLCRQLTSPVRFTEAVNAVAQGLDLLVEVGPGQVLSGLVKECVPVPVVSVDAGGRSLTGLLKALGAAFVLGAPINHAALFSDRFTRPFTLDRRRRFFVNPCELAPAAASREDDKIEELREQTTALVAPAQPRDKRSEIEADAKTEPIELVRHLIAAQAELPISAVRNESRLLTDLHLNSIAVGQLVTEAARQLQLPPPISPTDYANATVLDVARALDEMRRTGKSVDMEREDPVPPGVGSWVRAFTVELLERPLPRRRVHNSSPSAWRIIAPSDYPLARPLEHSFAGVAGRGVVVCLPAQVDERHVGLLLEGARAVFTPPGAARFVLVQQGGSGAAFARTLHLESGTTTCVVDVPVDHPHAAEWVAEEALAAVSYTEARYDASGRRRQPVLRLLPAQKEPWKPLLGPSDVLLVTGGGKGIAAECALMLAREMRFRLALMGRSRPSEDGELSSHLGRMAAAGVDFRYIPADVTDAEAVRQAVCRFEAELGTITAVLHAAGTNVPQLLTSLDAKTFLHTLAPKIQGARNVLAAVRTDHLRLFVTFGSIIAHTGMRGEADYAVANEWLAQLTEHFQIEHPHCRCLAVEWSVWSGLGMGERLGRIDSLVRGGITPIPPQEGVSVLRDLLSRPLASVRVPVTGRLRQLPTVEFERPSLPFLRFLERPRIFYPGVELIVDAELSVDKDPYLADHVFRGERLFPSVMGLEAMAQAAMAVTGASGPPVFEEVAFNRPIVITDGAPVTIRIAALVREPSAVELAVRSQETSFQVDHFRAVCRFGVTGQAQSSARPLNNGAEIRLPIDPERDLYNQILFHKGRFKRLRSYYKLRARECLAEIAPNGSNRWFDRYLPQDLLLGDPAARDAAVHALQACIPHAPVLPVGAEKLTLSAASSSGPVFVDARERSRQGDTFTYDLNLFDAQGCVLESWRGLQLKTVNGAKFQSPWTEPLIGPYIERRVCELLGGSDVAVVLERNGSLGRPQSSDQAIRRALGSAVTVRRHPDGRPEVDDGRAVSAAHCGDLTLAVAGHEPIACDIELVLEHAPAVWKGLLGASRFALSEVISREADESNVAAATRLWIAAECLKKAEAMINAPLSMVSSAPDGWVLLASGHLRIATLVTRLRGFERPAAIAILVGSQDAIL